MSEKKLDVDDHAPKNESYSTKIFKESTVGIISSIYQTTSLRRKAFKLLAFSICLFGFLYQSGQFLAAVFRYPTSVDVEIIRPSIFNVPGYTFCDNNGLSRRLYCDRYPDHCEKPSEALCRKFVEYCGENATLVPKKEYYQVTENITPEEMVELNVQREKFVEYYGNENVTGPYFRKHGIFGNVYMCYSLNSRVNNSLLPVTTTQNKLMKTPVTKLSFTIEPDEMFVPGNRPGILFSLHSPFEAVNPLQNGIFMKAGRTYMIFVSMDEELLLQTPYPTDCENYTENWEKRGRTGPRTQDMCIQECVIDISMACYNCVVSILMYPSNHRMCSSVDFMNETCPGDVMKRIENCEKKCKDDCLRTKYSFTVQERFNPYLAENGDLEDDIFSQITVEVYIEADEIVVLKHSPKYMFVEVFSNIGGFIGCWLGISLLNIADIFESVFMIFRHSAKIKKRTYV